MEGLSNHNFVKNEGLSIALDYDETYTAAPELFRIFVLTAKAQGHKVTFVTYRSPNGDNEDIKADSKKLAIDIVYTSGQQKEHIFKADFWIDDCPDTIVSAEKMKNMYKGCVVNKDLEIKYEVD